MSMGPTSTESPSPSRRSAADDEAAAEGARDRQGALEVEVDLSDVAEGSADRVNDAVAPVDAEAQPGERAIRADDAAEASNEAEPGLSAAAPERSATDAMSGEAADAVSAAETAGANELPHPAEKAFATEPATEPPSSLQGSSSSETPLVPASASSDVLSSAEGSPAVASDAPAAAEIAAMPAEEAGAGLPGPEDSADAVPAEGLILADAPHAPEQELDAGVPSSAPREASQGGAGAAQPHAFAFDDDLGDERTVIMMAPPVAEHDPEPAPSARISATLPRPTGAGTPLPTMVPAPSFGGAFAASSAAPSELGRRTADALRAAPDRVRKVAARQVSLTVAHLGGFLLIAVAVGGAVAFGVGRSKPAPTPTPPAVSTTPPRPAIITPLPTVLPPAPPPVAEPKTTMRAGGRAPARGKTSKPNARPPVKARAPQTRAALQRSLP